MHLCVLLVRFSASLCPYGDRWLTCSGRYCTSSDIWNQIAQLLPPGPPFLLCGIEKLEIKSGVLVPEEEAPSRTRTRCLLESGIGGPVHRYLSLPFVSRI